MQPKDFPVGAVVRTRQGIETVMSQEEVKWTPEQFKIYVPTKTETGEINGWYPSSIIEIISLPPKREKEVIEI